MLTLRRLALLTVAALLAPTLVLAAEPRRVLHVSLYPYIPDAPAAALTLKQGFERAHPDVIVDISLNPNYYSLDPADKGVLYEDADVHEIDVVFLGDFVARGKLAPLPADFRASLGALTPQAVTAATVKGELVAVPQWLCTDFLFYRADEPALPTAPSLAEVEASLGAPRPGPGQGLLMDMQSADGLGELYLSFLVARYGDANAALDHVGAIPDPDILTRMHRMLDLEPAGFGRNDDYHARGVFYARQFARRAGGALVGYSEMTHEILTETAVSCRLEDHCLTDRDIRIAAVPFADRKIRPMAWVDMFGIDAKVKGQSRIDAQDFVRYAVSLPAYRALLIPRSGDVPRYLLPATEAPFSDPAILAAAPLYPQFRAIIDQGVVVTAPDLTARLHDVASKIDADLPKTH